MHSLSDSLHEFATSKADTITAMAGINGCILVTSAYQCDINTLDNALETLKMQAKNDCFTVIFSDVSNNEEPDNGDHLYKDLVNRLKTNGVNRFIGIGPELSENKDLFVDFDAQCYSSTEAFVESFSELDFIHENILIVGVPTYSFENIIKLLQNKSHETVLEIHLNEVLNNYNCIKAKLKSETKLMVMIKAFAYGSGSYEIGRFLENNGVDYLSVGYTDEGVSLRQDGIKTPIMVLNPEVSSYRQMIKHQLEPQIYSFRTLQKFIESLQLNNNSDDSYPIHVKLNTGMNRLGFNPGEVEKLGILLSQNLKVKVVSVFSHLSGSDERTMDEFTDIQYQAFVSSADSLEHQLQYSFLRHILNSNGVLRHPQYQLDMVRIGIAQYGFSSHKESRELLRPVSRLVTTISQIRKVEKGQQVGYNPKSKLQAEQTIAVLAIGYADGYPRLLGNGVGRVFINGKYAHTVGNICMDMCMVDVTDIDCSEGDTVEVFGEYIQVYELAEKLQTIPYEVLTNISQRVKRISIYN